MTKHEKLAIRLADIMKLFNSGNSFTMEELTEEFDVDKRTIQRDLYIRLSFLPIQKLNGRYSLEQYYLGKLNFEDMKLFAALSGIKGLYPALDDSFITDILNSKVNRAFLVNGQPYEDMSDKIDIFNALGTAAITHRQIHFTYTEKKRMVNPYKLINTNGIWYLLADDAGILKTFALSKISDLMILDETFDPDKTFLEKIGKNDSKWFSDKSIEVVLEIDKEIAGYFLKRKLFPNQKIIENNNEKLVLSTLVAYEEEILRTVRYWLPHIVIRSPERLAHKLHTELSQYIKNLKQ